MTKKSPTSPMPALADLETVLVSEAGIKRRLKQLGKEISTLYGDEEITVIAIINGAILFTADLIRHIRNPIRLDCVRSSSYRGTTAPVHSPVIVSSAGLDLADRHVLLIDDILDTGKTLSAVVETLRAQNPASVRTCVLLDKKGRREVDFAADFVGFEIPDRFVVGYGLDFAERYRNLPCIGILRADLQNPPEWA